MREGVKGGVGEQDKGYSGEERSTGDLVDRKGNRAGGDEGMSMWGKAGRF